MTWALRALFLCDCGCKTSSHLSWKCFSLLVLMLLLALAHVMIGPRYIPLSTIFSALLSPDPGNFDHVVIGTLRLNRILAVMLAGAALGSAGYLLQLCLKNRLGEPHILGLNAGASLAMVLVTAFPTLRPGLSYMPFIASFGAGLVFALVLLLSSTGKNRFDPARLVFFGIALSALANAIVTLILVLDENTLEQLRFWLVGDAAGIRFSVIRAAFPVAVLGFVLALLLMPGLGAFALGEDVARALGASVKRIRLLALLAAALLSGCAVSVVGPIGFIGLIAPSLWPDFHSRPSTLAMILIATTGACLALLADCLAIGLLSPIELPTGAVTGLAGAPLFIWLVVARVKAGRRL